MGKQRVPQAGGIAHRRLCGKILGRHAAQQTDAAQQHQQAAAQQDIARIARCDAVVDDIRHDQRHEQVEERLQHFEQGRNHRLAAVTVQITQHSLQ